MSSITYYELSNYNGGTLIPKTFNVDGITYDAHLTEITEWREALTQSTGALCEEYIVCDVDDIPREFVGEWSLDEAFFELMEAIDNSHLDAEVFHAGIACGLSTDQVEDAYEGSFSSDEGMAEEHIKSTGMLQDVPDYVRTYFDVESFARDMMFEMYSDNGHYFHQC